MKTFFFVSSFLFLVLSCNPTQNIVGEISAQEFQSDLAKNYAGVDSPLNQEELKSFKGLDFYAINGYYKVNARIEKLKTIEIITVKTSKNSSRQYKKYGKLSFVLNDSLCALFVYQSYPIKSEYKNHLFLPFMDDTTGSTSYGAGRYIDLSVSDIKEGMIVVDFNKSYNPYCAYSSRYNCPITPFENTLDTAVEAGIRYKYADY